MGLLIVGGIVAVSLVLYFIYYDMKGNIFHKLGFKDNEDVNLDNVKFEKYYPNNKNLL